MRRGAAIIRICPQPPSVLGAAPFLIRSFFAALALLAWGAARRALLEALRRARQRRGVPRVV